MINDRRLSVFRRECKDLCDTVGLRKWMEEEVSDIEYRMHKPDQLQSHTFSSNSNNDSKYLELMRQKDTYTEVIHDIDAWVDRINLIIDQVPTVSMKYFIWMIYVERRNVRYMAESCNMNHEVLQKYIRGQLQESFRITNTEVKDLDIKDKLQKRYN